MELKLVRTTFTATSTIGELYINGKFECFVLEDTDRMLVDEDSLSVLKGKKVYGKTAIPTGRYEVVNTFSNRFKKYLPLLLGVPAYEGIRIHPGNTAENTEGCLLPGLTKGVDFVGSSKLAFNALLAKFKAVEKKEKIFITISNGSLKNIV